MNILVTGGSKGLGSAIVKQLSANVENHVYFTYYKSLDQANQITKNHKNTSAIYCDFNDADSVKELILLLEKFDIDVLINNATVSYEKNHFHKLNPDVFQDSFKVNILNTVTITQELIKLFRKKKRGKIITILSSATINKPPAGWSEYVASKNYLLSLSRSWATENIRHNISSNCVSPSFMLTDYNSNVDERVIEDIVKTHPLKKLLTVEEVALTIEFLTSCSPHINGVNIVMNAGQDLL